MTANKDKSISEWYPDEATILKRVIKLKGGKLHESDFDRIFNEMKKLDRGLKARPRYQMQFRAVKLRWGLTTRHSPCMGLLQGLQQQFLALAQDMKREGKLNITHTTKGVFYSIPPAQA